MKQSYSKGEVSKVVRAGSDVLCPDMLQKDAPVHNAPVSAPQTHAHLQRLRRVGALHTHTAVERKPRLPTASVILQEGCAFRGEHTCIGYRLPTASVILQEGCALGGERTCIGFRHQVGNGGGCTSHYVTLHCSDPTHPHRPPKSKHATKRRLCGNGEWPLLVFKATKRRLCGNGEWPLLVLRQQRGGCVVMESGHSPSQGGVVRGRRSFANRKIGNW
eukprot:3639263-Pyramimonas_sp.AAC.1